ncbi:hypothetical protein KAFR_0B06240 [Kazachstania africana CBS 2517]|uniref:4-hydroxy-3-methoxy-5-polyprenylbenzoate decarboxylase n=1 Tax=Kazachstania africana (strain ATCC 22294 / BCRC 22015 / CBS 2517 / CECT 1963 / NBRC 1671 / NRRL Y-8276) TaxID=1071382 RepID=H2ARC1_KAZAF|nr:hypothetical protein KAFR_0B06240 [Kazachstania africana CBS 2517]CCF56921.1 hypothetical protein KAFR_0B06240 [Kazachstania africana CBS 2517]
MTSAVYFGKGSLRRMTVVKVAPRRSFVLGAVTTATLGSFLLGKEATLANRMNNGELHNKNVDYDAKLKENVHRRLQALKNTRPMEPNYEGHVPLYKSEKLLLFLVSGLRSFLHPENGYNIVQLGEATAFPIFLESLKKTMLSDATGRRILRDKPHVHSETLHMGKLSQYPQNTFGYKFYEWCKNENVTPDTRAPVTYIDDPLHAYVFKRYRQCHDFYHALNNLPIIIEGEITVKALEAANLGVPMAALGAIFAPLRLKPIQKQRLYDIYLPWAVKTGLTCKPLINVYWEELLDKDIDELRNDLGITLPPDLRKIRKQRKETLNHLKIKYNKQRMGS